MAHSTRIPLRFSNNVKRHFLSAPLRLDQGLHYRTLLPACVFASPDWRATQSIPPPQIAWRPSPTHRSIKIQGQNTRLAFKVQFVQFRSGHVMDVSGGGTWLWPCSAPSHKFAGGELLLRGLASGHCQPPQLLPLVILAPAIEPSPFRTVSPRNCGDTEVVRGNAAPSLMAQHWPDSPVSTRLHSPRTSRSGRVMGDASGVTDFSLVQNEVLRASSVLRVDLRDAYGVTNFSLVQNESRPSGFSVLRGNAIPYTSLLNLFTLYVSGEQCTYWE
ncbi:hypothetical protein EDB85DRAFT_1887534 [Lactarius pseudohatsudake]|nr:hypothetical protein EDB85DRAFT_1887534 [Lactarius pseudohatsudake]